VGDKNEHYLTKGNHFEICCLSSDPDENSKFSTLGAVSASRRLELKVQKTGFH
jgi:hypothetical protein